MLESVELGDSGSCMQNSLGMGGSNPHEKSEKEYNGTEVLEEPFVKKAIELFDAQKIKIRSKI
jgi:hypothetical protein